MTVRFGKRTMRRSMLGAILFFAIVCLVGQARAESVVIVQGFQSQSEQYAAQTVDAYVRAFGTRGASTTAFRPQSQPGWEGGEAYGDRSALMNGLSRAARGDALVLVIVGDADPDGALPVTATSTVTASDLADAVSGATRVSIVSAGCNALARRVAGRLANVDVVVAGMQAGQKALTWPKANRGQYDLFTRYLLEGFYLLATNDSVTGSTSELIARAFPVAERRMRQVSGGLQTPVGDGTAGSDGLPTSGVVRLRTGDRAFTLALRGGGNVSGFVSNTLGLPIAPIQDGRSSGGQVTFSFVERGGARSVAVSDVDAARMVTVDDRSSSFDYSPMRVDLVRRGQVIGTTYVTTVIGGAPHIETIASEPVGEATYRASERSFTFTVGTESVTIGLAGTGNASVVVGGERYRARDVLRYGLYAADGIRVATLAGVASGGKLTGEIVPSAGQMRIPITADVGPDGLSGTAELVGTTYRVSSGWTWSTNRPPTQGKIQSDFLDLPAVADAYADATRGDGGVVITWDIDDSRLSDPVLLGDLGFEVVRVDRLSGMSDVFRVPAGRRQYADRPNGDPAGFDYSVRPVLDHRVVACGETASYPLRGVAVVATPGRPTATEAAAPRVAAATPEPPAMKAPASGGDAVEVAARKAEAEKKEAERKRKEAEKEKKEAEKKREDFPWNNQENKEGIGGKIVYGLFGALIILGIALAIGVGGSSGGNGLPPDDTGGVIDQ